MYSPYGPKRQPAAARSIEPVNALQDDHPALSRNLLRDLQTEHAKLVEELILASDWADFEKRRGLVNGVATAIHLCQTAKDRLDA